MLGTHLRIASWMIVTYHQLQQNKIQILCHWLQLTMSTKRTLYKWK
jgi:hypothetical protein